MRGCNASRVQPPIRGNVVAIQAVVQQVVAIAARVHVEIAELRARGVGKPALQVGAACGKLARSCCPCFKLEGLVTLSCVLFLVPAMCLVMCLLTCRPIEYDALRLMSLLVMLSLAPTLNATIACSQQCLRPNNVGAGRQCSFFTHLERPSLRLDRFFERLASSRSPSLLLLLSLLDR